MKGLLEGKRGLIMGVANVRSIAWGIVEALLSEGVEELAITYQGDVFKKRVMPLAQEAGIQKIFDCDVRDEVSIQRVFDELEEAWGGLDFVVHALAFADKEELKGPYVNTSSKNFQNALQISTYSLTHIARLAQKIMHNGGSILTLSYYGAEKVMPHYNVMGIAKAALEASVRYLAVDLGKQAIRVNSISAGPIKTLAASGIGDFNYILKWNEYNAPLKRTVTLEEIGNSAVFLLSDMSKAITGEVLHVDCGYHVVGMKAEDAPDIALVMPS